MTDDVDDLAESFHVEPRKLRRKNGQCEAISVRGGRCGVSATRTRDGHKVCLYHFRADYPIPYCTEPKP